MSEASAAPQNTQNNSRFVENDDDTIIDMKRRLIWCRQDSWQLTDKWLSWVQARDYAQELNKKAHGGYKDWRMPTTDEVRSLFDKSQENTDHMGQKAFLVKLFPPGFGFLCWTKETRTKTQAVRFNFRKGGITFDDVYRTSRGATRYCRDIPKSEL
ncbi:hypothetical protein NITGR_360078 [Nitrospina gracilis 3/211]|uniref:Lcl C-terminal domain-containing protein n=1 Tax=Nitrospina gracilis (strain 3/211) TaxID=1266370 RepID=M1ZBX5_NITG3|nr:MULTISPECIES: DUF1566 domain-containing protein [Nitrospina]MCF8723654.1 hypothetical protein [Nitrospina sp. Nb-3]CCQ90740.1 hypothetical protein NITGR_360078 [Nitrospina gracilis 3/211]